MTCAPPAIGTSRIFRPLIVAALALAVASAGGPAAADVGLSLGLSLTGDGEIKVVTYDCDGHDPIIVRYVNAAPNFLALVPVKEGTVIFAGVYAATGVKYVGSTYVWLVQGTDATLTDVTAGSGAAPLLRCSEEIDTP